MYWTQRKSVAKYYTCYNCTKSQFPSLGCMCWKDHKVERLNSLTNPSHSRSYHKMEERFTEKWRDGWNKKILLVMLGERLCKVRHYCPLSILSLKVGPIISSRNPSPSWALKCTDLHLSLRYVVFPRIIAGGDYFFLLHQKGTITGGKAIISNIAPNILLCFSIKSQNWCPRCQNLNRHWSVLLISFAGSL